MLPGGIMHCGPAVKSKVKLRAVMFFTATPIEERGQVYNSDTQYGRSTLIYDILYHSWPDLSPAEKKYMLTKWTEVGLRNDSQDAITKNMNHKHLIVIALALRKTKKGSKEERALIARIAEDSRWIKVKEVKTWWPDVNAVYTVPT
jgi:hypothetical protein